MALTVKESAFAEAVVKNGGDKVAAYKAAGYSVNMTTAAIAVQADKLFNKPKINLKISEMQKDAEEIAEKAFSITIKQRLEWLKEITEAGLSTYLDSAGNERRENLSAAKSAIDTMNAMLGTGADDENTGDSINITFNVSEPVSDVKVTRGE